MATDGKLNLDRRLPKFSSKEKIHIIVAGGNAGKFSVYFNSWASGETGSIPVSKKIEEVAPATKSSL